MNDTENARRQLRHSQPRSSGNSVSSAQYGQYITAWRLGLCALAPGRGLGIRSSSRLADDDPVS
jgi:hypothetical protein